MLLRNSQPFGDNMPETYLTEGLQWAGPVPRQLVHRSRDPQVFITSVSRMGDGFVLGARWPPGYPDDRRADRELDPMVVGEIFRQAGICVAHAGYGVAFDHQFLMEDFSFYLSDACGAAAAHNRRPVVGITCTEVDVRRATLRRVRFAMTLTGEGDGACRAKGSGRLLCLPGPAYGRLRDRQRVAYPAMPALTPLPPEVVGCSSAEDVLLGSPRDSGGPGASTSWPIRVDPAHPMLFDHPVDHLPGMVQFEVFRQAGLAVRAEEFRLTGPWAFRGSQARFLRIAASDAGMFCEAEARDAHQVAVRLIGSDGAVFTEGSVRMS